MHVFRGSGVSGAIDGGLWLALTAFYATLVAMKLARSCTAFLGMASALFLSSCGERAPQSARPNSSGPPRSVRLAYVERRPMERIVTATGILAPKERSTISTKVAGRIQRLEVDLGSAVLPGDLIAQIEPKDYELRVQEAAAALAESRAALGLPLEADSESPEPQAITSVKQAKALLEEANKNMDRIRALTESKIISVSELDTAEAASKVAQTRYDAALEEARARVAALAQRRAEYEIARKQLADTAVRAPFGGAVQERPANVGEYVAAGAPIVTIVNTDPLRLKLEVPERESMLVRAGQLIRVMVESDTNIYTGRISRLSPALDETKLMLLVEADVPNPGSLRGGLFARRAEIIVNESEEGLSVPSNALITFAGIEKVVIIDQGKALEKTVHTGRSGPGWVEILSGITLGTPVILDPGGLRSGQPVSVTESKETIRTSAAAGPLMAGP